MPDPAAPRSASELLLYQTEDGRSRVQIRLDGGSVWMTQVLMAELYQSTKQNISLHIQNNFEEGSWTRRQPSSLT